MDSAIVSKSTRYDIRTCTSSPALKLPRPNLRSLRVSPVGHMFRSSLSIRKQYSQPRISSNIKRTLNLRLSENTLKQAKYASNCIYKLDKQENFIYIPISSNSKHSRTGLCTAETETQTHRDSKPDIKSVASTLKLLETNNNLRTHSSKLSSVVKFRTDLSKGFDLFYSLYNKVPSSLPKDHSQALPNLRSQQSLIPLPSSTTPHTSSVHRTSRVIKSLLRNIDLIDCETPRVKRSDEDSCNSSFGKKAEQEKEQYISDIEQFTIERSYSMPKRLC
jgi:hypothetical protein